MKRTQEQNGGSAEKRIKMSAVSNKVDSDSGVSRCFHLVQSKLYLSLAPSHLNAPIAGIKSQHLNQMVMKYNRDLDGIVVGYRAVELITEQYDAETVLAKVSEENPFTFMWVKVQFIVWSPKVGDLLEGYCVMQSRGHIGLLINDVFNATIRKKNIPSTWEFVPNQQDEDGESSGPTLGSWQDASGNPIDGKLKFTVKAIQAAGKGVAVEGTLLGKGEEPDEQPLELSLGVTNGKHITFGDDVDGVKDIAVVANDEDSEDDNGTVGYADEEEEKNTVEGEAEEDSSAEAEEGSDSDSE